MTKKIFSTALAIAAMSFTPAVQADEFNELPSGIYMLDNTHASVTWQVSHMGLSNYTARFTDIEAEIDYNPESIEKSVITAQINPASVTTDYPNADKKDFDKKLSEGEGWFNSTAFPTIDFKSTNIKMTGDDTAEMTGDLTFLGVTKPATLNVTFNGAFKEHPYSKKAAFGFSAKGSIKRSDFGMTTYIPNIGDEVALIIETEFVKSK